jgi:Uma2 family endonuclease
VHPPVVSIEIIRSIALPDIMLQEVSSWILRDFSDSIWAEAMAMSIREPLVRLKPKARHHPMVDDKTFARFCSDYPDLRIERTSSGELIIMPPAGGDAGRRNMLLSIRVGIWFQGSGLGVAFDSSTGFTLPNGAVRSPDASWIASARWNALTPKEKRTFSPICPDFVAELRSPSDSVAEVRAKMREYRSQGARLGWLIDPARGVVEIYRPKRRVRVLKAPLTVSGEDVLPGFTLDLKGILFD